MKHSRTIRIDEETYTEIIEFGTFGKDKDIDEVIKKIIALAKKQRQEEEELIQR